MSIQPLAEAAGSEQAGRQLARFIQNHRRILLLTGAGCSTDSGIPGYRDAEGHWQNAQPIQHQAFVSSEHARRQYWLRSLAGWPVLHRARPNAAHLALSHLQRTGALGPLITQNVDGLHRHAGSRPVIELHGRARYVRCLGCRRVYPRQPLQQRLLRDNPDYSRGSWATAPDGDALGLTAARSGFRVPACPECRGILKPDVVFFGDSVPAPRLRRALAWLDEADALLVVGSSLMVFSGYRFCRRAHEQGKPIAALNQGVTRADPLLALKLSSPCASTLSSTLRQLQGH